jgi:hypothetical protein
MTDVNSIYAALKAPFPLEAISTDKSRGFALTSLKAQYIVERMNDVLGIDGWQLVGEYESVENEGVLYKGELHIKIGEQWSSKQALGFSKFENKKHIGDIYKSSRTDALSKSASYIGVGNEVFKGNVSPERGYPVTALSAITAELNKQNKPLTAIPQVQKEMEGKTARDLPTVVRSL